MGAAAAALLLIWFGFGHPPLVKDWDAASELEAVRIALFVVGGIGGVVALVVAYCKQRVAEAADIRAEASKRIAEAAEARSAVAAVREDTRLFNERFTTATGISAANHQLCACPQ